MNSTAIIDSVNNYTASNPTLSQFMCTCNNDWTMLGLILFTLILFWVLGFMTGGNIAKQP